MDYVLKTEGLTKRFGGIAAVDNVSMTVREGDIYGFIGKNGAGKTTLMRMVSGLAAPDSGEVGLFGSFENLEASRGEMGCVIETPALVPSLSAMKNLALVGEIVGVTDKETLEKSLAKVGLENMGRKPVKQFSYGQRQRLAIAMAMLGNPRFLVLDEPINGLDPTAIIELRDTILRLNAENGITFLISSHILGELAKIATRYGVINLGKLVAEFDASELPARAAQHLRIVTKDIERAVVVLKTELGAEDFKVMSEHELWLFGFNDRPASVNSTLAKADVEVEGITLEGTDPESYFVSLMGGKN